MGNHHTNLQSLIAGYHQKGLHLDLSYLSCSVLLVLVIMANNDLDYLFNCEFLSPVDPNLLCIIW